MTHLWTLYQSSLYHPRPSVWAHTEEWHFPEEVTTTIRAFLNWVRNLFVCGPVCAMEVGVLLHFFGSTHRPNPLCGLLNFIGLREVALISSPFLVVHIQTPGLPLISPKYWKNYWFVSSLLRLLTYLAGKTTLSVLIFLKTASPRAWKGGTPTSMLKVSIPRAHLTKRNGI